MVGAATFDIPVFQSNGPVAGQMMLPTIQGVHISITMPRMMTYTIQSPNRKLDWTTPAVASVPKMRSIRAPAERTPGSYSFATITC